MSRIINKLKMNDKTKPEIQNFFNEKNDIKNLTGALKATKVRSEWVPRLM